MTAQWTVGQRVLIKGNRYDRGTGVVVKVARKYVTVADDRWPDASRMHGQYEIETGLAKPNANSTGIRPWITTPEREAERAHRDDLFRRICNALILEPKTVGGFGRADISTPLLERVVAVLEE